MNCALASLASLPQAERERQIRSLTAREAAEVLYDWRLWARPNQIAPAGEWRTWLILAGRGFGKSRAGAEWMIERARGGAQRAALVGSTAADARDVMVQGESGILACSPPWFRPTYETSKRRITWPRQRTACGSLGPESIATTYSAEEPDRLRGPQHDTAWADELAAWSRPECWDQLMFGLRLGTDPRVCVTTTPRPEPIIRTLIADPTSIVTRGSTYENKANLPAAFLDRIIRKYENSRLGRQELHAEMLDDAPGSLWKHDQIDALRVTRHPELTQIVIGVDPAVTVGEDSDETGIIVAGLGDDGHAYVLADLTGRYSPAEWAARVVKAFDEYGANRVIAETNQGGDMVEANLRTARRSLPIRRVHASRGKRTRAEPIAALYEQRRVHHLHSLPKLEDEMCTWEPGITAKSPDHVDAMVYALTDLLIERPALVRRDLTHLPP